MSAIILLGASAAPFLLVAAIIRGGWRAHQERASFKQDINDFE
jgi:hypothetical protein